ncbi:MAG: glycosyltransferase family 2 protein [Deltaproteobacteria bacterium]|nr:MAG: glycosyltransferase family 2 protein [Deltaproteobacteria bacterium]
MSSREKRQLSAPEVSVVIPVHNEKPILADVVMGLVYRLPELTESFEIIIAENGSTDGTLAEARKLASSYRWIKALHVDRPNYGRALRQGISIARGRYCVCDEIDLCDMDFYRSSLGLLRKGRAEMVIGSKLAKGARDERPLLRRVATRVFSAMLRYGTGFRGTDTHGPKAFERKRLLPLVKRCKVEENLFASELVIRAEREGVRIVELPLVLHEKRQPTINLLDRVPRALANWARLVWIFQIEERMDASYRSKER